MMGAGVVGLRSVVLGETSVGMMDVVYALRVREKRVSERNGVHRHGTPTSIADRVSPWIMVRQLCTSWRSSASANRSKASWPSGSQDARST